MRVFGCTSWEGGYPNSGISRDFMALEVLENRISGNHKFLLTVRLRLLALSCRLGWYRLVHPLCCNMGSPARGSSESSIIVICSTVVLISRIHLCFIDSLKGLKTVSGFVGIRAHYLLPTFCISIFASRLMHPHGPNTRLTWVGCFQHHSFLA